uniref:NADH-ubiquinone oxidoreductase chain 5 n=1 Tax=Lysmata amboinensis TaxID=575568 RepID=A0A7G7WQF7_9EUCA|nr:NADH dehydrogenase subunit 5 [Lysmata amboinensis]QNH68784.1 NADH dehydrogenase subunit 5 [Lysmata amboinensis]
MLWDIKMNLTSFCFLFLCSLSFFGVSVMMLFNQQGFLIEWEIVSLNSSTVVMAIIFDWMSSMFMSFVMFISCMVLYYSGSYMKGDYNINRFMYLVLGFVSSMMFLIISPNLISILLGWDGLGLVSYALVIYYQNEKSCNAGMLTALSNRVGDVAILLSIGLMSSTGGWNYVVSAEEGQLILIGGLVMLVIMASMTKSAQIPFSAWLPAAMAAPTPVSALVHSSTLVTAGVYLLIRFSPAMEGSVEQSALLILASLTMFMAGLGANFETDLKKIIALSTLSQLGVMMFTLSMGLSDLAFFHLLTHALFKALLFMCAGSVIHSVGDYQDIRVMGGLVKFMPLSVMSMNLANLALCGSPFLAGFYSKDLILEVAFSSELNLICFILLVLATSLTVCYSFRLVYYSLSGDWNLSCSTAVGDDDLTITSSMFGLVIGAVVGGSLLSWLLFPSPEMICLSPLMKMLALIVSVMGGLIGYGLNLMSVNDSLKSLKSHLLVSFMGSMWFMPFLSTYGVSKEVLKVGVIYSKSGDSGWLEYYGSQGTHRLFMSVSAQLQVAQDNNVKIYMMIVMLWLVALLVVII